MQPPPKLLDQMRDALRARHYSPRTEQAYVAWARRYIYFHHIRHPAEMGDAEINAFLTHLAVVDKVSASTQTQALAACCSCTGTCWGARSVSWRAWSVPSETSGYRWC